MQRYRNLPVRAKLLVPFAILMIIWGGFGTYVLARGAAGEARGRATARLAEALDGGRAAFADIERRLLETQRLAAYTQGVNGAIARGDAVLLRRLLLPIAVNAGHFRIEAVDARRAIVLRIEMREGRPVVRVSGKIQSDAIARALKGRRDALGDRHVSLDEQTMMIAGPVRDDAGRVVGAIAVAEPLAGVVERMARGVDGRVAIFSTEGQLLASNSPGALPHRKAGDGLRASVNTDGGDFEALYAPLVARGTSIGTVAVALPSGIALAGVKGTATLLAALVGGAVLAAVLIGLLTARAITRPLGSLLDATKRLEKGELSARAEIRSKDEVGTLAQSFNKMADELQASHEELERKVAERTAELEHVNTELERASNAKSAFLATMSHELRTPLNAIIGFADMMSDPSLGPTGARESRELAGNILASGRHLLTLINDVLDLAKVEAGKIDIRVQRLSLGAVLAEVESVMRPLASEKRIKLSVASTAGIPKITADPQRLRQVLYNLLSNAIKFTPNGGSVSVEAARSNGSVTVSVADTGPGLTRDEAAKIFEPYERGRASRKAEGAGLGLALARHLVELQQGRIWVVSRTGKGSTFHFTVPVAVPKQETHLDDAPTPAERRPASTKTDRR